MCNQREVDDVDLGDYIIYPATEKNLQDGTCERLALLSNVFQIYELRVVDDDIPRPDTGDSTYLSGFYCSLGAANVNHGSFSARFGRITNNFKHDIRKATLAEVFEAKVLAIGKAAADGA
ncbi:MAG: hypothetical protein E6R03_03280 [Hyphomicrobiaceae bacterium]|nr:MAG: hypothetical protein E6R03_03280 [Hyphomicrobiaceae bacterium]